MAHGGRNARAIEDHDEADHDEPRDMNYRSLGLLRLYADPEVFRYFEYRFLEWVYGMLTECWGLVQGGTSQSAMLLWTDIFMTLELDERACQDLMLLAHLGEAGRAEANEILWQILTVTALKAEYKDISHKVTSMVGRARRNLDRPPRCHRDRGQWNWRNYWEPRNPRFSPRAVPQYYTVLTGDGGKPLPPPDCFGPAGP